MGLPLPDITCLREGKPVISCSKRKIETTEPGEGPCVNGRYELTKDYTLRIERVSYSKHHGKLLCIATNMVGSGNFTFKVNVTGKKNRCCQ